MPSLTPPAPSLASLPREIINHISIHLDKPSFLRLIRVSKAFAHLSNDHCLWTSLALHLPPHYGERPLISPLAPKGRSGVWGGRQRAETNAEYSIALKALISTVICRADKTRWAKVKAVELEPMPQAWIGLAQVLDSASASLLTLYVRGELGPYLTETHDRFDYKLLGGHITFPSLTHLHIGSNANVSPAILSVVCNRSPGLRSLNVSLIRPTERGGFDETVYTVSRYRNPTAVRVARIEMAGCIVAEEDEVIDALAEFLLASPSLRQLSLPHDGIEYQCSRSVMAALAEMPSLEDLHWPVDLFRWQDLAGSGLLGESKLRRLVLACGDHEGWVDLFQNSLRTPSLEKLYLDASSLESRSTAGAGKARPVQVITPESAEHIREHPKLHIIHTLLDPMDTGDLDLFKRLDAIEDSATQLGHLSSVKGVDCELLHARIGMQLVEKSDRAHIWSHAQGEPHLEYRDGDGGERIKIFERTHHAVWQDYTSFDDLAVPLEVLEEMRRIAGISETDWRKRGVVVNDKAWAVLRDWHETTLIELAEDDYEDAVGCLCHDDDCLGGSDCEA